MPKSSVGRPSKLGKSLAKLRSEAIVCAPDLPELSYRVAASEDDDDQPPLVIASCETLYNKPSTRRNKKLNPQAKKSTSAAAAAAASPTESEAAAIAALSGKVEFPLPSEDDQRRTADARRVQPQLQFMQPPLVLDGPTVVTPPPHQQQTKQQQQPPPPILTVSHTSLLPAAPAIATVAQGSVVNSTYLLPQPAPAPTVLPPTYAETQVRRLRNELVLTAPPQPPADVPYLCQLVDSRPPGEQTHVRLAWESHYFRLLRQEAATLPISTLIREVERLRRTYEPWHY